MHFPFHKAINKYSLIRTLLILFKSCICLLLLLGIEALMTLVLESVKGDNNILLSIGCCLHGLTQVAWATTFIPESFKIPIPSLFLTTWAGN